MYGIIIILISEDYFYFMTEKQNGQIQMIVLDIDSMIKENHLVRQIKDCKKFDFILDNDFIW